MRNTLITVSFCILASTLSAEEGLKIAFIYEHPTNAGGWSLSHEQGRLAIQNRFGERVSSVAVEGVKPGPDTVRTLTNLAREHYDMIFATSFGHMNPVIKVARSFPRTTFQHASGYKTGRNVGTYQIRAMEGRYLAGIMAGHMSKTKKLGFVASFPIPEVIRGINAFALGARSVDPAIAVQTIWINSWMDAAKEREAAELLINLDADVVTHHTESPALMIAAENAGVWAVGYQYDRSEFAPEQHLVTVEHNWAPIYEALIEAKLTGHWESKALWLGLAEEATRLVSVSPLVPEKVLAEVETARQAIANKTLQVFSGPLNDADGTERIAAGVAPTDEEMIAMEWFVEGVVNAQ